jgi:diguanylate cyclase (GGDEF)-like protein
MTQVLRNLGHLREREGNFQGALHDYDEALALAEALGDPFQVAHAQIARGQLLTAERPQEARENLERALERAEQISSQQLVFEAHRALGHLFEKVGDIPAALRHVRIAWSLERSLYMESAGQRMRQLTATYQQESMHRTAEIEREKNAELQKANETLRDMNSRLAQRDAENSRLLAENQKLAVEDPLTGLYNRRHFDARLQTELERARRFGRPLSLAMADLDHFKRINDRFLHQTGDAVLKIVAQRMRDCLREVDYVARYGGEEFVILLPETGAEGAARVCDKIRKAIEEVNWGELAFGLTVSISMGVSDDVSEGGEGLLRAADQNLYKAKDAGRNRVCA